MPARGVVTQEIPIVNNSSQEWKVVASLEQKGNYFQLKPNSLNVKKKDKEDFTLSFKPTWVMQHTALLTLRNDSTKEEYEYEPHQYIKNDLEESDAETRRRHCMKFVNRLSTNFSD